MPQNRTVEQRVRRWCDAAGYFLVHRRGADKWFIIDEENKRLVYCSETLNKIATDLHLEN